MNDDILEGVTRRAIIAAGRRTPGSRSRCARSTARELYVADEVFLCGTGVQVSPVIEVDHRPVGTGAVGPIAADLRRRYFDAVRGRDPRYASWLTTRSNDGRSARSAGPAQGAAGGLGVGVVFAVVMMMSALALGSLTGGHLHLVQVLQVGDGGGKVVSAPL